MKNVLTPEQIAEMRRDRHNGAKYEYLAAKYRVSHGAIWYWLKKLTYPQRREVMSRATVALMIAVALALMTAAAFAQQLPQAKLTPGVAGKSTSGQLCNKQFHTRDVRLVTSAMKRQVFSGYGIKCSPVMTAKAAGVQACSAYEVDHLISLELGGANDVKNLWPQPIAEARHKDVLENWLHAQVCSGTIALKDAQRRIATNWVAEYRRMEQSGKVQGGSK
jgi:hypothetical protein